ncbi:MAG TPA: NAD-dependent epimerase/dehydratase family protein [Acidimicrobiales bacterium]
MCALVVTGGSGFLGQHVVGLLAGRRDAGRVVTVDLAPGLAASPDVQQVVLDLANDPTNRLDAAMDGAGSVIHLAWSHRQPDVARSVTTDVVALRRVLDAAARAQTTQLVHLSSATVYGAWPDNPIPIPEDAPIRPNPGFAYAIEKAEAERIVAEWAEDHPEAAVAVLRPAVTVGAEEPALYQALAGTRAPGPDDGERPMQFLHVNDLATAVVFAWEHRLRGVYNVAPDGWIEEGAARALVGGLAQVTLPGRLARGLSAAGWEVLRAGTPKEAMPYSTHPWVIANDRLRSAGWNPRYSNEEALVGTDDRNHWSDMPPSRRQELALMATAAGVVAAVGGAAGLGVLLIRRLRKRTAAVSG